MSLPCMCLRHCKLVPRVNAAFARRLTLLMNPYRINPDVDYRRLHQLSDDFTNLWKRLQSFYLDAAVGFAFVRSHIEADQERSRSYVRGTEIDSGEFQDRLSFSYTEIFCDDFCTSAIHEATQGEVKARNAPGGANFTTLAQLCLVSFYDYWNDYLRREYVIAKGKLDENETKKEVVEAALREYASHDLWGDIRHLRTSIVHNQGIATSDVIRCKHIKWFQPGDPIALTPQHMRALFLALLRYRTEWFNEQFPEHYMQIPSR